MGVRQSPFSRPVRSVDQTWSSNNLFSWCTGGGGGNNDAIAEGQISSIRSFSSDHRTSRELDLGCTQSTTKHQRPSVARSAFPEILQL